MISIAKEQRFYDFANKILECSLDKHKTVVFANLNDKNEILTVLIFFNFSKYSCEVALASRDPRGFTREFLCICCKYAFITSKKYRISCTIKETNTRCLKLALGLGFKVEGCARSMFGKLNGTTLGLLRSECKYLRGLSCQDLD